MARDLIHFVPDRLNAEPVAYRGFTTPELAAATGLSLLAGLVIGIVPGLVWTWVIIPTCALFMPFVTILLGGRLLVRLKRGRPDNWLWQMAHWRLAQAGLGKRRTVTRTDVWGGRREGGPS
ncbi:TIGR03750 family conjugal transfer protein [Klebsiella variicola]|uniref:TIGR03750 family conjugal transfer protein n=1 Tax=Klebsiella variicola TaxID=244366 RepID=UPI000D6EB123